MKQKLFWLLVAMIVMGTAGCSFIGIAKIPEAEKNETVWNAYGSCNCYKVTCNPAYKYQYKNVVVTICPYYRGGDTILFGPPLIPIVPNFFGLFSPREDKKYYIEVAIDSPTAVTMVDISGVRVQFSKEKILSPTGVQVLGKRQILHIGEEQKGQDLSEQKIVVSHGTQRFRLLFDILDSDVKSFHLNLDKFVIDNETIELPPIQIVKKQNINIYG